ncbi:endonuclease-reverse transcriptase [Apostichopus japonicus]|uniref:Endonuclease-reverse transcriptase n=1 Tax=Stichopus japonicus TaxID=307972 RepID=A0A2G8JCM7_STIJA|nr:endonuclease-reverse transcriptase [Apostichopus japonicus]
MQETLQDHHTSISIGGRPICNLRFADDIDLMGGNINDLQDFTNKLATTAGKFGMEISKEKSKILVNSRNNINAHITINNEALEEVSSFKNLGVTLTKDGTSAKEIQIRIASATAAMTRLNVIWKSNINFSTKFRLYTSLVVSILLYGCEAWTLLAESERQIQAFETKCLRKLLRIRKTNGYVRETVGDLVGPYVPLLSTVKRRKLAWFGHVTRHDSMSEVILQGTVEGGRRRGRQRRNWSDNVKDWIGLDMQDLLTTAANRSAWRTMSAATVMSPDDFTVMGLNLGYGKTACFLQMLNQWLQEKEKTFVLIYVHLNYQNYQKTLTELIIDDLATNCDLKTKYVYTILFNEPVIVLIDGFSELYLGDICGNVSAYVRKLLNRTFPRQTEMSKNKVPDENTIRKGRNEMQQLDGDGSEICEAITTATKQMRVWVTLRQTHGICSNCCKSTTIELSEFENEEITE